jgi:hypothetical protein
MQLRQILALDLLIEAALTRIAGTPRDTASSPRPAGWGLAGRGAVLK